jgi:hypothetical protein
VPLSIFQEVSLDTNHLTFDPFTRKIYATVPSTAMQVTGNSVVALDPTTGSLGTPLAVGSEPDAVAESGDGQFLYVGLDGAKALTRVDLTSMTEGVVYPLSVPGFFSGTLVPVTPRELAVLPGNDNTVAIDTQGSGTFSGIGIFDIDNSGTTGAFRQNFSGSPSGSEIAFADAGTLYSSDLFTSPAEFHRWAVAANGLTKIDDSTVNGFGGGSSGAFRLANGLVYGFFGGLVNAGTTPPAPPAAIGQYQVAMALQSGIQATGVAPDPAANRVFFLAQTFGNDNPVLLAFDQSSFELLDLQQFPLSLQSSPQVSDLVHWGQDGIAWRVSSNGVFSNTPGSGKVFLVRGPFVLPTLGTVNPLASLSSTSPAMVAHGGGNFFLSITGSNFVPGAAVLWNGAERTTTFVDSNHLTAAIPASDVAQAGSVTITVKNPATSASGSVSFTIN